MKGIVLAPLETVEVGQEFSTYPPHITLVPPFELDEANVLPLCEILNEIAADWLPFRCTATELAQFGNKGEVTVRKIAGWIFGGHAGALVAVRHYGGNFDATWTGVDGWVPHISDHEQIQEGHLLDIECFALISSTAGIKKVIGRFGRE